MEQESVTIALPQQRLTRVDFYKIFLGKESEVDVIADFLKRLLVGYGRNVEAPVRFLDAGCGLGRMFHKLATDFSWHVTGMEPDPDYYRESVKIANELRQSHPEVFISTEPCSFATMAMREQYDMIAAINGPFYYLLTPAERLQALKNMFTALVPGGVMLLDMANFQYLLHSLGDVPDAGVMVVKQGFIPINSIGKNVAHSSGWVWFRLARTHRLLPLTLLTSATFRLAERIVQKEYGEAILTRTMNIRLNWHASAWIHTDAFAVAAQAPGGVGARDAHAIAASAQDCVEVHTFSITSPPDIAFLVELAGFQRIKFFNSWTSEGVESEVLQGPRVMIAAQKPQ